MPVPDDDRFAGVGQLLADHPVVALLLTSLVIVAMIVISVRPAPAAAASGPVAPRPVASPWARKERAPRHLPSPWLVRETRIAPPGLGSDAVRRCACRWRIDAFRARDTEFRRWLCLDCEAEGYTRDDEPPRICKRGQMPRGI
jgi:hypothetical protein